MRLVVLSRYARNGASSRLRLMQYVPALQAAGIDVEIAPFFDEAYLVNLYAGKRKPVAAVRSYLHRVAHLLRIQQPDLIWIEKEALPWVPWGLERMLLPPGIPFVSDYDDAVFHRYDQHRLASVRWGLGRKLDHVMAASRLVIAGNAYLADRAHTAGAPWVEIVPTVVDAGAYDITPLRHADGRLRIGWVGTPGTWADYMAPMLPMLLGLAREGGAVVRGVGASGASADPALEILPWSEDSESAMIQGMGMGLMPLDDTPWSRGKCGYKLIQYMACGIPVIASPVGVNAEIVEHGVTGFLARTPEEWREAVRLLLADPDLRRRMGAAGRQRVEQHYSLQKWAGRIAELLWSASRR